MTMSGTFKVKISDLRGIIRELIGESMIAEKFGEPIGKQNVGVGVPDERDLKEAGAKDLRGHTCEKCKKGKYEETSIEDDWGGWLHCGNCNNKVKRWKTDEGKKGAGGSGTCDCPCEDCAKYPHDPNECACGTNDWTNEVAPKGYEKVVKGIKKDKSVKNPWAVAWSMKKKGVKPKK